jgi:hypothetical protein
MMSVQVKICLNASNSFKFFTKNILVDCQRIGPTPISSQAHASCGPERPRLRSLQQAHYQGVSSSASSVVSPRDLLAWFSPFRRGNSRVAVKSARLYSPFWRPMPEKHPSWPRHCQYPHNSGPWPWDKQNDKQP